jgi:hypothetical protein
MVTKRRLCLLTLACLLLLTACEKEKMTGDLEITFYPYGDSNIPESLYYYLYNVQTETEAQKAPPLVRESIGKAVNNTAHIRDLNPGNYIFKYYVRSDTVYKSVQVTAGTTRKYEF